MSENNNNNENKDFDEVAGKIGEFADKAVQAAKDAGNKAMQYLDVEKQKAQIRSEIGQNNRELTKAYESLGRAYYSAKVTKSEFDDTDTFDLIRSKEKVIELLEEKLSKF